MKKYNKLIYIFMIFFLIGGCKIPEKKVTENENSIEIIISCGEDNNNLDQYIKDGWKIKKEYAEEKVCSWKTIIATKDCDLEKIKAVN